MVSSLRQLLDRIAARIDENARAIARTQRKLVARLDHHSAHRRVGRERVVRNLILKRAMHSRHEYRDFRGPTSDVRENTLAPNVHSVARAVIMEPGILSQYLCREVHRGTPLDFARDRIDIIARI